MPFVKKYVEFPITPTFYEERDDNTYTTLQLEDMTACFAVWPGMVDWELHGVDIVGLNETEFFSGFRASAQKTFTYESGPIFDIVKAYVDSDKDWIEQRIGEEMEKQ